MPRFKGACGCYNKEDATKFGLATAVIWFDILNHSEIHNINPVWYDQRRASERTGIPYRTIGDAINKLEEAGRLKKKIGYRPGTTTRTTWIEILVEDLDEASANTALQKGGSRTSKKGGDRTSILKDTNIKNTVIASQPKVAPQTSRKKSEFNLLIEKLCEILSLDVTKLNWSAVGKWHKVGKASNCTDEDFIKAAEAMRDAAKSNGFTVSLQKVLTNTEYWLRQAEDKKPKRGMIIT